MSRTIVDLAGAIGVELLPTDIDVAHRLGVKSRSNARPVIVKFTRFEKRQELYAARKRCCKSRGRGFESQRGILFSVLFQDIYI